MTRDTIKEAVCLLPKAYLDSTADQVSQSLFVHLFGPTLFNMLSKLPTLGMLTAAASLANAAQPSYKTVYTFPEQPSWYENVHVGAGGKLVLTTINPTASVHVLRNPWDTSAEHVISSQTLPGLNGTLGLAQVRDDVYAVAAGQFENISEFISNSSEVWLVDVNDSTNTRRVAEMPEAGELNGMVAIPNSRDGDVLIADSSIGQIWKVSTLGKNAGKYESWLKTDEMTITSSLAERWGFGINGLQRCSSGKLYFTNTNTVTIWSIDVPEGVQPEEKHLELVADLSNLTVALDDFALSRDGKAIYVTSNKDNKLFSVKNKGDRWVPELILGGEGIAAVAGDTGAAFGQTKHDQHSLYVVTSGRGWSSDNDTLKGPAQIVSVDLSGH